MEKDTKFKKGGIPWNKGVGEYMSGEKNHFWGKKHSIETKIKQRESKLKKPTRYWLGKKRENLTGDKHWHWKGNPLCVDCGIRKTHYGIGRCKNCFYLQNPNKGEKHWNWNGGITPLRKRIRECFKYRQWRSDVFTKDGFTCQICGMVGNKLNADHIESFEEILFKYNIKTFEEALDCEKLWDINNGRTLCENCHQKTDNYGNHKKRPSATTIA